MVLRVCAKGHDHCQACGASGTTQRGGRVACWSHPTRPSPHPQLAVVVVRELLEHARALGVAIDACVLPFRARLPLDAEGRNLAVEWEVAF